MTDFVKPVVSMPGSERIARAPMGARVIIHATAEQTAGAFGIWETLVPPGKGPEPHSHDRETECFRVLTGVFRFRCGDEEFIAHPGTTVVLPPHVEHAWVNISDEPGRIFAFVTPGGFEHLFMDIEATGADTPAKIAVLEARYGVSNAETAKLATAADR